MTEEEAKAKWCPFARQHGVDNVNCIGSACMAWRWQREGMAMSFEDSGTAVLRPQKGDTLHGYCGVAGKP